MSTGVDAIDEQHKKLINALNELSQAMMEGRAAGEVDRLLNFLDRYVTIHFRDEERCMEAYSCPVAQANKAAHVQFMAKVKELRRRAETQQVGAKLVVEAMSELTDWLISHVRACDTKLRDAVKAKA